MVKLPENATSIQTLNALRTQGYPNPEDHPSYTNRVESEAARQAARAARQARELEVANNWDAELDPRNVIRSVGGDVLNRTGVVTVDAATGTILTPDEAETALDRL